jgi:hypothetical protein
MSTQPVPEEKFGIHDYAEPEHVGRRIDALIFTLNQTIAVHGYEPTSEPAVNVLEPLADDDGVVRHEIRVSRRAIKSVGN